MGLWFLWPGTPMKGAHLLLVLLAGTNQASVEGERRDAHSAGDEADCEGSELFEWFLVDHLDSVSGSGRLAERGAVV